MFQKMLTMEIFYGCTYELGKTGRAFYLKETASVYVASLLHR